MDYYSGQGQLAAAKKNTDGSLGPRFRLGNVPRAVIDFSGRKLQIDIEQLSLETLEIICGTVPKLVDGVLEMEIGNGSPFEYELFFNGVNTASNNKPMSAHLYRVTFGPTESWELIGDGIAAARVSAKIYEDETRGGKVGQLFYAHKESETGNRLTDMRVSVEVGS